MLPDHRDNDDHDKDKLNFNEGFHEPQAVLSTCVCCAQLNPDNNPISEVLLHLRMTFSL